VNNNSGCLVWIGLGLISAIVFPQSTPSEYNLARSLSARPVGTWFVTTEVKMGVHF
jgi:hypothetical protein